MNVTEYFFSTYFFGVGKMKNTIERFLRDEGGSASVDAIVVLGGTTWMLVAVAMDIGTATIDLSDRISHELKYNAVVYDILEGYGPNSNKVR